MLTFLTVMLISIDEVPRFVLDYPNAVECGKGLTRLENLLPEGEEPFRTVDAKCIPTTTITQSPRLVARPWEDT